MRLTKSFAFTVILALFLPAASLLAVEEPITQTPQVADKPVNVKYPFIAEVIGTGVYVRSGNSTADYSCTKLDSPDKVTVVTEEFGWAKILPPEGCYSWIYKASVKIDPDNPSIGIVEGENVLVWAGSDNIEASRSSGLQACLNKNPDSMDDDDIVDILPNQPETGEYYRIKPPVGAYLWISATYLKYVAPLNFEEPIVVPSEPETQDDTAALPPSNEQKRPKFTNLGDQPQQEQTEGQVDEEQTDTAQPKEEPEPKINIKETQYLQQCHELSARIDEELKKALSEQNYASIKEALMEIKQQADAGKSALYAQFLMERIGRYELAKSVTEELQKQDQQLEKAREKIARAHQAQLDQIPEEAEYLYIGTLKPSHVYTAKTGQKRYLLTDSSGKILCYVVAASPQIDSQLEQKVNTVIGINGSVVSNQKSLVALVAVTDLASVQ